MNKLLKINLDVNDKNFFNEFDKFLEFIEDSIDNEDVITQLQLDFFYALLNSIKNKITEVINKDESEDTIEEWMECYLAIRDIILTYKELQPEFNN